jgi:hypothetical protein
MKRKKLRRKAMLQQRRRPVKVRVALLESESISKKTHRSDSPRGKKGENAGR